MDIAALSTSMAMTDVANQASIRVLSMSLDDLETAGDGLRKMMEMSVNPGLGANIPYSRRSFRTRIALKEENIIYVLFFLTVNNHLVI